MADSASSHSDSSMDGSECSESMDSEEIEEMQEVLADAGMQEALAHAGFHSDGDGSDGDDMGDFISDSEDPYAHLFGQQERAEGPHGSLFSRAFRGDRLAAKRKSSGDRFIAHYLAPFASASNSSPGGPLATHTADHFDQELASYVLRPPGDQLYIVTEAAWVPMFQAITDRDGTTLQEHMRKLMQTDSEGLPAEWTSAGLTWGTHEADKFLGYPHTVRDSRCVHQVVVALCV